MSYPRRFKHSINLRSDKLAKSPRGMAETLGCAIPMRRPASSWVRPRRRTTRLISITKSDLNLKLVGVRQAKIGKHVAGTGFDFDAVNHAFATQHSFCIVLHLDFETAYNFFKEFSPLAQ